MNIRKLSVTGFLLMSCLLRPVAAENAPPAPDAAKIKALIEKLNADDVVDREKAEQDLVSIGDPALEQLQEAQKSPVAEIAVRAKGLLARMSVRQILPKTSYAEAVPASSIFFIEAVDAKALKEHWKLTPLSKAWATEGIQAWWNKYQKNELDEDQKRTCDAFSKILQTVDGRAVALLGGPETVEKHELYPPFVLAAESRAARGALEALARTLWAVQGDAPQTQRKHGPFNVEEHLSTQSVCSDFAVFYSFMPVAMDAFLNGLLESPKESLAPVIAEVRELLPQPDLIIHGGRKGLKELSEAGHELEENIVKEVDALGLTEGSSLDGAIKLTEKGFEEAYRFKLADPDGLLSVISNLTPMPAPADGAPTALDMLPPQALWVSVRGDLAAKAEPLIKALRTLDKLNTLTPPPARAPAPVKAGQPAPPPPAPKAPPTDPKLRRQWDNLYLPKIERLEKLAGIPLEQLLAQVQGGAEFGVFFKSVGAEVPDEMPIAYMVSVLLKDTGLVTKALEAAVQAEASGITKEDAKGGTWYVTRDDERKAGWWLKDNRLVFASEEKILDLAVLALEHKNGVERLTDRPDVKALLEAKTISANSRCFFYADAGRFLEMPYNLGRVHWGADNDATKWPDYKPLRSILGTAVVQVEPGPKAGEAVLRALTPLTVVGIFEALRRPINESGW